MTRVDLAMVFNLCFSLSKYTVSVLGILLKKYTYISAKKDWLIDWLIDTVWLFDWTKAQEFNSPDQGGKGDTYIYIQFKGDDLT